MQKLRALHTFVLVCILVASGSVVSEAASSLVISQVYVGSLSPYGFIELFNRGTSSVTMDGWTLQSSAPNQDATWTKVPLSGTVGPGQYYLIRISSNFSRVVAPAPDTDRIGFPVDPGGGQIALVQDNSTLLIPCALPSAFANVSDLITWGSSPCGSPVMPWQDNLSMVRTGGGCPDNSVLLFTLATPIPRNTQSITNPCSPFGTVSTQAYTVPASGGFSTTTTGSGSTIAGGSARIEPASGSTNPTAFAIFALRQSGTLISEASVPATAPLTSGFFFADVSGSINTGVAIANMNTVDVDILYQLTDAGSGTVTQSGMITVAARTQFARFLNELPFGLHLPVQGTLTFSAAEPVSVIALRGNTNGRGDFLVTTMPVIDASAPVSNTPGYLAHFAVNNGWKTDVILICQGLSTCTGTVSIRDASGNPATVKVDALVGSSFPYSLVPQGSEKFTITGVGNSVSGGTMQINPSGATATPIATAVFSFANNNISVSEAGLTTPVGTQFRTYVEYSGAPATVGSIQPGIAIANTTGSPITVGISLTRLDGTTTGFSTSVSVPANGQVAKFANELFPTLTAPFQGILTATSNGGPIAVIGLRGHYNERRDFLITTVPAVDQNAVVPTTQLVFPHIVDSGGYTTQFVLFGPTGQASNGNLRFFTNGGQPLPLQFK